MPDRFGHDDELWEVSQELSRRLSHISKGEMAGVGLRHIEKLPTDPIFATVPFHEYFHGDNGKGLGKPSNGMDRPVAKLLQQSGE